MENSVTKVHAPRTKATSGAKERFVVLCIAVFIATTLVAVLIESMLWYRTQVADLVHGLGGDWQAGAVLIALYSSYAKNQVALVIAAILAMLGVGLSLHAMKESAHAEVAASSGWKFTFASFSRYLLARDLRGLAK